MGILVSKTYFVTYASGIFKENVFWNKLFVNIFIKPYKSFFFTDKDLKEDKIYEENREIFDSPKGAGYWAWKPWVILEALNNAKEGDILLYQDCGKGLKYKNFLQPTNLIRYAKQHNSMPGILVPIHGKNKSWTHHKCFEIMNCSEEKYLESSQIEASVSVWKVNEESKKFVKNWLQYCLNKDVVGELSSYDNEIQGFLDHRYDQSVLTNLVLKYNLKPIKLSFDDMHISKSMSLIDLDLRENKYLLKIILFFLRLKNKMRYKIK